MLLSILSNVKVDSDEKMWQDTRQKLFSIQCFLSLPSHWWSIMLFFPQNARMRTRLKAQAQRTGCTIIIHRRLHLVHTSESSAPYDLVPTLPAANRELVCSSANIYAAALLCARADSFCKSNKYDCIYLICCKISSC